MTATTETAKCRRCHRALTKSAALGIGPVCALREAREHAVKTAGLTADQQVKALEILADGGVIPSTHKGVWLVISGDGGNTYRATAGHCTCKWGLRKMTSATVHPCAHAGAVIARLTRAA